MESGNRANVLIAGGGVAALEAALALRELAPDLVRVELVAPEPLFWYRPIAVAEPFKLGEVRHFDLSHLAFEIGAAFSPGELVSVDATRRLAYTSAGATVPYSMLLLACGAIPRPAVEGAVTFRGPADTALLEHVLTELQAGEITRVAYAVPAGAAWSLPAYELALLTAAWADARGLDGVELVLVTPEQQPLQLFGREASESVQTLLDERGIAVRTDAYPAQARPGELVLSDGDIVPADRVVALPRLQGPRIGGVPQTFEGFIPVDRHGRVAQTDGIFAAGDITTFPVKQGGLAAQQADAAAAAIAAEAGAAVGTPPFRPVLRGLLLTGGEPRYLRGELAGGAGGRSQAKSEPLWWPPVKIVGRHLAPFLAGLAGTPPPAEEPDPTAGIPVEVELEQTPVGRRDRLLVAAVEEALGDSTAATAGEVMSTHPLLVAAGDTLGEVAEWMRAQELGSALVVEDGRLVGILTSRDLLRALAGRVDSAEARVGQWMTAEPIAVSTGTTIEAAAGLMTEHGIHHLPVVDGERPVGMLGLRAVLERVSPLRSGIGLGF
jgi:sulfide:quinone oxidoreductase